MFYAKDLLNSDWLRIVSQKGHRWQCINLIGSCRALWWPNTSHQRFGDTIWEPVPQYQLDNTEKWIPSQDLNTGPSTIMADILTTELQDSGGNHVSNHWCDFNKSCPSLTTWMQSLTSISLDYKTFAGCCWRQYSYRKTWPWLRIASQTWHRWQWITLHRKLSGFVGTKYITSEIWRHNLETSPTISVRQDWKVNTQLGLGPSLVLKAYIRKIIFRILN